WVGCRFGVRDAGGWDVGLLLDVRFGDADDRGFVQVVQLFDFRAGAFDGRRVGLRRLLGRNGLGRRSGDGENGSQSRGDDQEQTTQASLHANSGRGLNWISLSYLGSSDGKARQKLELSRGPLVTSESGDRQV